MVLVNNPGTSPVYWPLDHAEWNGLTPTDWIFPFFLFIVGVSIAIALGKYKRADTTGGNATVTERADHRSIYTKIITRFVSIYLCGLAISVIPFFQFGATDAPDWLKMLTWLAFAAALLFLLLRNFKVAGTFAGVGILGIVVMNLAGYNVVPYDFSTMRILGVLQRIAICYLITSIIFLNTNWKQQLYVCGALLLGYWFLITMIPVPGCEVTTMNDKACNLAAYIDRIILTESHIWRFGKVYDPEGLLSTIPAIVTTLSGVLTGTWLLRRDEGGGTRDESEIAKTSSPPYEGGVAERSEDGVVLSDSLNKASGILFFGTILLALGLIWNSYFPMNKALWTSSYVLATTGLALLIFGCCYWLIDIKGYKKWAWPFVVFGANALALFVFSGICARMISAFRVAYTPEGRGISLQRWIVDKIFLALFQPINASLAFAISFILFWLFLMWLLYRKGIYIKV
jgi:predicted acyltransferase